MRRIVLIDGENLVYGLRTLLAASDQKLAPRNVISSFDFRGLIEELLSDNKPTEILWFGARLKRYDYTDELREKSEAFIREQSKFMNHIQAQKVDFLRY